MTQQGGSGQVRSGRGEGGIRESHGGSRTGQARPGRGQREMKAGYDAVRQVREWRELAQGVTGSEQLAELLHVLRSTENA